MTDNRPIGVCDSGIGGLSVFSKVERLLPGEKFVYFGDTANIPYGTKSAEELHEITKRTMNFFMAKNVKAVILACNTISAVLFDKLKGESDFTIYPVLQTSIKMLAKTEKRDSVGV
ncbi:MAG: glutamate racemase, partial [Candidatus Gastranaerophilaceae bacterium]